MLLTPASEGNLAKLPAQKPKRGGYVMWVQIDLYLGCLIMCPLPRPIQVFRFNILLTDNKHKVDIMYTHTSKTPLGRQMPSNEGKQCVTQMICEIACMIP